MSSDLVLLGWFSMKQDRVAFVRTLQTDLKLTVREAANVLDASLGNEAVVVSCQKLTDADVERVGQALASAGCEVRFWAGTSDLKAFSRVLEDIFLSGKRRIKVRDDIRALADEMGLKAPPKRS